MPYDTAYIVTMAYPYGKEFRISLLTFPFRRCNGVRYGITHRGIYPLARSQRINGTEDRHMVSTKKTGASKSTTSAKKTGKKPVHEQAVESTPVTGAEIIYDTLNIMECSSAVPRGPLTPEDARDMMGWQTEGEYQKEKVAEGGGAPEHYLYGDIFHCTDVAGNKVQCWNNAGNRSFDEGWCEELIHTILQGQWAGPLTIPGETINGETVRIGRHGRVLSGQHQLTALILADEHLAASRREEGNAAKPKYPFWNGHEHPVIETIVITGLSEDERVLRTIDYVKPRTVADMLYTMDLYKKNKPVERKELTRMLAAAIDTLWDRTDTKGYKTHPEVVAFLQRHMRLLKAVEHLFVENAALEKTGGRRISKLRLSPGMCSALLYIMGSSGPKTDGDKYRNGKPPSEKGLDWSPWDKAREFWTRLASGRSFLPVREKLNSLVDTEPDNEDNQGLGGRLNEKLAIISKAWEVWKEYPSDDQDADPPFSEEDKAEGGVLWLTYSDLDDKGDKLPKNQWKLVDIADFGGIDYDLPKSKRRAKEEPMPAIATREEIEKAKEETLRRKGILPPEELQRHNEEQAKLQREEQAKKLREERERRKK